MGLRPTAGLSDPWLIMVAIPMPWLSWIITQGLLPLIYIWPIGIGYASYWIIWKSRKLVEFYNKISCATGDLICKLINKLDDHFWADYDINWVSSQITLVIVNKMRIVLTLVNSNLGLYNLSSELRMLISNRWSWPSLFAFNIFSVRPANSGLFYL